VDRIELHLRLARFDKERRRTAMKYRVTIMPAAREDLDELPNNLFDSITRKIAAIEHGLPGSVKPLTNLAYGYRVRIGHYRILFDLKGSEIIVQRVQHRRHAYASQPGRKKHKGQH
jgi:mRNA interferase RelE/StbE